MFGLLWRVILSSPRSWGPFSLISWTAHVSETEVTTKICRIFTIFFLVILVLCWSVVAAFLTFTYCVIRGGDSRDQISKRVERYSCFCCWKHQGTGLEEPSQVFTSIAKVFDELFEQPGSSHIVASDIIVGLALVESAQHKRKEAGEQFRFSRQSNTKNEASDGQDVKTKDEKKEETKEAVQGKKKNWGVEDATEALRGNQPILSRRDWERLEEAKYFARYAIGAYGWMLYTFLNPCCVTKCSLCRCQLPLQHLGGERCSCQCDEAAFMQYTGCFPEDILCAQLKSAVGKSVYYLSIDRLKKKLVLSIRGTLSIQDAVTDMNCEPSTLPELRGEHKGHRGIWNNVWNLRSEIREKLISFLESNRDYGLQIVGHSLGAATAALLAIYLNQDFEGKGFNIRCVALAPPALVSEELALCAENDELITSVVYHDDIIPHLSLGSMTHLRNQMIHAFHMCGAPSKWKILRLAIQRKHTRLSLSDDDPPKGFGRAESSGSTVPIVIQEEETSKEQNVDGKQTVVINITERNQPKPDNHLYVPGRIFHIVNVPVPAAGCCASSPIRQTVYVSHARSFTEIIVSKSMLSDHMPGNYMFEFLPFPRKF